MPPALRRFAPAKINLTLHVTGRRPDGYHNVESLVAFADIGDEIELTPAEDFSFTAGGPFAGALADLAVEDNLAVRAARRMAEVFQRPLACHLALTKNLPLAAGLGGGSADAAAAAHALAALWEVPLDAALPHLAALGADLPACLAATPVWAAGIGETLAPAPASPSAALVLVNPLVPCPTLPVFARLSGRFSLPAARPDAWPDFAAFADFIQQGANDLTAPAMETVPAIGDVLASLDAVGSVAARLCGSGATCFGLFQDKAAADRAAEDIARAQEGWWVQACTLLPAGRPLFL